MGEVAAIANTAEVFPKKLRLLNSSGLFFCPMSLSILLFWHYTHAAPALQAEKVPGQDPASCSLV
jgi:hypothetical protein